MIIRFTSILVLLFGALASQAEAIDSSLIDKSVDPCTDFYQYACGNWIKKTEIPADRPTWTRGFDEVTLRNQNLLKQIFEDYSKGKFEPNVPYAKEMGDIYASCMDEKAIEANARKQFADVIAPIMKLDSVDHLAPVIADLHLRDIDVLFSFNPTQDAKNSELMIGDADQGGMGLPTKNYYTKDTPDMVRVRNAYKDFANSALVIAGWTPEQAKKSAEAVLALETKLANGALLPEDRRDPIKMYHRLERKGLIKSTPKFAWNDYFQELGQPNLKMINVDVPIFFTELNKTLKTTSLDDLKAYLVVRMFRKYAPTLDKQSVDTNFKYMQAVMGMKELPPRWKRCVDATGHIISMAVGRAFVEKTFGTEGKKISSNMMHEIELAMGDMLNSIDWMDAATRKAALAKLATAKNSMGYPDKWRSYDALKVSRDSYLKNYAAGEVFSANYELNKIGKPVDRDEWMMPPFLVNAENIPQFNQMRFPAGILQPPNFDAHRDSSANYGGMGVVMGHELTHSYDDEGRRFDKKGDMKDWWSKKTATEFEKRAQCLVDQFSGYQVEEGLNVNGKLTLGENIADQGGVKLAFAAWKKEVGDTTPVSSVKGFTPEQVLFLGFGQMWCSKDTPQFRRLQTNSNPHSLPRFRVTGALSDNPDFAKAFSCKPGSAMVPKNQCVVW